MFHWCYEFIIKKLNENSTNVHIFSFFYIKSLEVIVLLVFTTSGKTFKIYEFTWILTNNWTKNLRQKWFSIYWQPQLINETISELFVKQLHLKIPSKYWIYLYINKQFSIILCISFNKLYIYIYNKTISVSIIS